MVYRLDWLGWVALFLFAGWAMAAPGADLFRDTFGFDRVVVVASMMGGFCAVTFSGGMVLSVIGILASIFRVAASAAFGMYCGGLAAPILSSAFGPTVGTVAPAPAAFTVALLAPLIYGKVSGMLKKEP